MAPVGSGNGAPAPSARCNRRPSATKVVGGCSPSRDTASAAVHGCGGVAPISSRVNCNPSSAGDGVDVGVASRTKWVNGSAMSSADGRYKASALAKGRDARQHVAQEGDGTGRVSPVLSHDLHQGLITLDHFRRPRRGKCRQPPHGILQEPGVIPFGRKTRPLDQHCRVLRLQRHQPFQFLLSVGVGVRSAGVLDLLHQRRAREEILRIELDSAPQLRDPFVAAAARRVEPSRQECDIARGRRQRRRTCKRRGRRVEVTEPQIRQSQIGPRRPVRLARARSPARIPAGRRRSGPLAGRQSHDRSAVSSARRRQTTAPADLRRDR